MNNIDLLKLPEMIEHIFFNFDNTNDLINASKTCKLWYNISNHNIIWKRLLKKNYPWIITNNIILSLVKEEYRYVKKIELEWKKRIEEEYKWANILTNESCESQYNYFKEKHYPTPFRYFNVEQTNDAGELIINNRYSGDSPKMVARKVFYGVNRMMDDKSKPIKFTIIEYTKRSKHKRYNYIGQRVTVEQTDEKNKGSIYIKYQHNIKKDNGIDILINKNDSSDDNEYNYENVYNYEDVNTQYEFSETSSM
jgi:hypothetical protein